MAYRQSQVHSAGLGVKRNQVHVEITEEIPAATSQKKSCHLIN